MIEDIVFLENIIDERNDEIGALKLQLQKLLAQPEQEPVAWMNDSGGCFLSDGNKYSENWTALYTSPPKREPLSDETIAKLWWNNYVGTADSVRNFARGIEKAHGITGVEE